MGKGFLTIEQIFYLAKSTSANPKAAHPAYLKEAVSAKFAPVSMVDRKDLLDFLTGKSDTSNQIDVNAPAMEEDAMDVDVGGKRGRDGVDGIGDDDSQKPKQRPLHTRDSALQCDKSFAAVLGFFGAQLPDERKGKESETKSAIPAETVPQNIEPLRTNRFDRGQDKQNFYKEQLGSDFVDMGIVDDGGFLGGGNRRVLPDLSHAERLKAEQVTGHKIEDGSRQGGVASRPTRSASKPGSSKRDPAAGKMPVILVPPGYGSKVMFNMYNAAKFLESEKLVTWDELHKKGRKKQSKMVIKRRYKRAPSVKYLITDQVPTSSSDWACVVAVFVSGKTWQFKDWPFKGADEGDLVETFQRVRGFYAQYDTETAADVIKTWNVQTLRFQKNVRHGDRAQFEQFWNEVDKHLELNRSSLAY